MEMLDISSQDPMDFSGKSMIINNTEYIVGEYLGTGADKIVLKLSNIESGLCLHVVKIYRDQDLAQRSMAIFEESYQRLRSDPKLNKIIPPTLFIFGHGGYFELQNYVGSPDDNERFHKALSDAEGAIAAKDAEAARKFAELVLDGNPNHTIALDIMAACYALERRYGAAYQIESRVCAIEPNYVSYRYSEISYAFNDGLFNLAADSFQRARKQFPYIDELSQLGVHIFLECGTPELASNLTPTLVLDADDRIQKEKEVEEAIQRKKQARALYDEAKECLKELTKPGSDTVVVSGRIADLLRRAREIYDKDAFIVVNYALSSAKAGSFRDAANLLISQANKMPYFLSSYCYANAGYCFAKAGDWQHALLVLDIAMGSVKAISPEGGQVALADLPGLANWIGEDQVIEKAPGEAQRLVQLAISECTDRERITDNVREMAALLARQETEWK